MKREKCERKKLYQLSNMLLRSIRAFYFLKFLGATLEETFEIKDEMGHREVDTYH